MRVLLHSSIIVIISTSLLSSFAAATIKSESSSSSSVEEEQTSLRGSSASLSGGAGREGNLLHDLVSNIKSGQNGPFSSCISFKDESTCNSSSDDDGIGCVWCSCLAVPSACFSEEQAKALPSAVFKCDEKSNSKDDSNISNDKKEKSDKVFTSPKGITYSLNDDDEVDRSLCDPDSKSLAGYMDVSGSEYDENGENKHLFYWFFEKRGSSTTSSSSSKETVKDSSIPFIVWLTGGPGCSSSLALLTENGPCSVTPDGQSTTLNPYSWTEAAHVLWLDQPAGVGFSYGEESDYNEEMISEDVYYFFQAFMKKYPEYSENPFFVVGESYGGHYAPAVAHKIWMKNKELVGHDESGAVSINLSGLAVGNGLTNPIEQYKWYPEMAYHNSHGIQTVTRETYEGMKEAVPKCVKLIEQCNGGNSIINKFACQSAFVLCNVGETSPYQVTGLNPYDIRKECGDKPLCYDFDHVVNFLNLDSTKEALHVSEESHKWETCNMVINLKFHTDWMKDFSPMVADMLNDGIPALIYAGDVDFICNYLGNQAWTLGLEWPHKEEFNDAEPHEWGGDETKPYGMARSSNGLTFLQVYDAGHMVPSDVPEGALEMIQNFVNGGDF